MAKKEKINLLLILTAIFSFIFTVSSIVFIIILPNKTKKIKELRTQSLVYRLSGQDEVLLLKDLKETEEDREKIYQSFPDEVKLLDFIGMVDDLRTTEVEVIKFTVDSDVPTKIGKGNSFLPMSLMISGKEEEVDKALNKITDSKYFIKTVKFTKEYDAKSEQVMASIAFHLFVADEFN